LSTSSSTWTWTFASSLLLTLRTVDQCGRHSTVAGETTPEISRLSCRIGRIPTPSCSRVTEVGAMSDCPLVARTAARLTTVLLAISVGLASCHSSYRGPLRVTVTPAASDADQPIRILIDHARPGHRVAVEVSSVDTQGSMFSAKAVFTVDRHGQVDVTKSAPAQGSYYSGVDAMGLITSMTKSATTEGPSTSGEGNQEPSRSRSERAAPMSVRSSSGASSIRT
jgi:hypothetical protein